MTARTILPTPIPAAVDLYVADNRKDRIVTAPAAGATATATFGPVDPGELWLIERIAVFCSSSTPTLCVVYQDTPDHGNEVDGTTRGNFDIADEANPILLADNESAVFVWTGCSNGAVGSARLQYRVLRRRSQLGGGGPG